MHTMKLAEALSWRKDLKKRIAQLHQRLASNAKVQEGEKPLEDPQELFAELEQCLVQFEDLVWRINASNMQAQNTAGVCLTQLLAQRDALTMRLGALRAVFSSATEGQSRYSRTEIKMLTTIDVKKLSKDIDAYSARLRQLDVEIQALNFSADLL